MRLLVRLVRLERSDILHPLLQAERLPVYLYLPLPDRPPKFVLGVATKIVP